VSIALNGVVHLCRFLIEALWTHWRILPGAEETLRRPPAAYGYRSGAAFAGQQAFAGRHYRQIAGDDSASAERFPRYRRWRNTAPAEIVRVDCGDGPPDAVVLSRQA
jgi:hypothetical protein